MKIIWLMIFCLGLTASVFSQTTTITKEQYESVQKLAHEKISKIPRREITITKFYAKKRLVKTTTLTIEYLPPDKRRWEVITKEDGKVTETLQLLYIGDFEYRKEGDNPWKIRNLKSPGSNIGGGGISGEELNNLKQYLSFNTTLNNKPVTVYSFYRVYDWGKTLNFYDLRIWIDSEGLIIKTESTISDIFPDNIKTFRTETYEYNPKDIKPIEAPIK